MPLPHVVVIGASAGGVEALLTLARELRPGLPAAICVVLHQPRNAPSVLPRLMARAGELDVVHAEHDMVPEAGTVYLAPPNQHLLLDGDRFRLDHGPLENGHRPAIDPLFRSAARAYGPAVTAVVLSGSLDDGAAGCVAVKQRGGSVVVQDPDEALYDEMPRAAMHAVGSVDAVVSVQELVVLLDRLRPRGEPVAGTDPGPDPGTDPGPDPGTDPGPGPGTGRPFEPGRAPNGSAKASGASDRDPADPQGAVHQPLHPRDPVYTGSLSCPSCGGSLHREGGTEGQTVFGDARWRCRVGHGWSLDSLFVQQGEAAEAALWAAVRVLEERSALCRRLRERARQRDQSRAVHSFDRQARDAEHHARSIRASIADVVPLLGRSEPDEGLPVSGPG
jgi:two-component system, chemotaxis family, protein-glutamate methylesterase/glutaminase